jgi:hypothetical protein
MNTLKNEIGYVDTAEQTLLFKNMKPISHPYYMEYEALRVTCMKILRDTGISFFNGDSEETSHGILFYIPDLWEMYLEREVFQKDFYNQKDSENTVDVSNQKTIDIFYNKDKGYIYKSRPDYIVKNKETPFMILDAKFKPKWFDVHKGENLGYLSEDYDKCIRDMVSICGHATGTIFPVNECEKSSTEEKLNEIWAHSISDDNPLDRFYTIPVFIPSSTITGDTTTDENKDIEYKDYSEWKNELEDNIKKVKNELEVVFRTEVRVFLEIRTNPSQILIIRNDKNFIYINDAHKE